MITGMLRVCGFSRIRRSYLVAFFPGHHVREQNESGRRFLIVPRFSSRSAAWYTSNLCFGKEHHQQLPELNGRHRRQGPLGLGWSMPGPILLFNVIFIGYRAPFSPPSVITTERSRAARAGHCAYYSTYQRARRGHDAALSPCGAEIVQRLKKSCRQVIHIG